MPSPPSRGEGRVTPARHDACGGGGLTYVFHARNTSTLQEAAESFGAPGGGGSSYVASGSTTGGGNTVTVSPSAWSLTPNVDVGGVTHDGPPARSQSPGPEHPPTTEPIKHQHPRPFETSDPPAGEEHAHLAPTPHTTPPRANTNPLDGALK